MVSWWLHSDVSKHIRLWCTCTKQSGAPARNTGHADVDVTDETHQRKEVYGEEKEKKKKNKEEEFQLANLASPGSLASN